MPRGEKASVVGQVFNDRRGDGTQRGGRPLALEDRRDRALDQVKIGKRKS